MEDNGISTKATFKTFSLNIVAYLATKGIKYEKTTRIDKSTSFEFTKTPELENSLQAYRADKELQTFISILREMKKEIAR